MSFVMEESHVRSTRSDLPTGTITFVFTDIEGSTRLLDRLGERYRPVLEDHQRLLRQAFSGGVEVSTEGDSFFVVFASAPMAVAAAVEAQRALSAHPWPDEAQVRVRIGLHTGEAQLGADNYVGVDLHRAARIASVGHGGQIVLSASTHALVEATAPEGVRFRDLGEHRLKDLPRAEHLYQVVAEGVQRDFPSLRTMGARPNNLPVQLTSFVGRRRELEEVMAALESTRLLTLTGPGGSGKTRLSIRTGQELLPRLEDGAFFVALAPISDPALVVPTIAQALSLTEKADRPPLDALIEHLRHSDVLLVLDNFEQVLDAAGEVGQLLTATDRLRVLATSREPLGLSGEREYPVPPLDLPDVEALPSLDTLSQFEAVRLFVDRATAVKPGFAVTNENAPAVAEICARLDGLPLAIELAAARVKILTPQAILQRLGHSLRFLAVGTRDVPTRQRTLRDAIAWSHDLLAPEEAALFVRLSVFRGGFSLEAVERVGNTADELGIDTLEGVASLANKSLVRQAETGPDEPRFFMLETIREFAEERLAASEDTEEIMRRHAAFFLEVAERAEPELTGPDQIRWLNLLEREHDNLRAALGWAADHDLDVALRIGGSLWRFWQFRGHLREAKARLEGLLERTGPSDLDARARALEAAGGVVYWMGDFAAALRRYEECLELRERLGDSPGIAEAKYNLAFAHGIAPKPLQDIPTAVRLLEEARDMFQELGDRRGMAKALWGLATVAHQIESWERAAELAADTVELFRELDDRFGLAWALHLKGLALALLNRSDEARPALKEALAMFLDADDRSALGLLLGDLAILAGSEGDRERAIRLAGAAVAAEDEVGTGLLFSSAGVSERVRELEDLLPQADSERIYAEGKAMSVDNAVAYAREGLEEEGLP
jgi:predicted ATPase/class 3 adenylate cyclase